MPLLPSGPAASWHLSPWRRLIASSALARGERHTEREKPSLHPFICFLQWWPSPTFPLSSSPPPPSPLLCLLSPHHHHPLSSKTLKMKGKKIWQIYCFKSSWECRSRLRAQDITTAFPLTSIQIWRGVSEYSFYDGVLQREQKEIQSFFCLISLLWFWWMCVLLKWKIFPVSDLTLCFCCNHFEPMSACEQEHSCQILYSCGSFRLMLLCNATWSCCGYNDQDIKKLNETV